MLKDLSIQVPRCLSCDILIIDWLKILLHWPFAFNNCRTKNEPTILSYRYKINVFDAFSKISISFSPEWAKFVRI